ncbi:MAG: glycosyltransferase family 9 protein, partial [Elusimicrobia bacterium]|nr:glycosyltransferase family 9 protein [Elusimicrobiota bacterium]
VAVSVEPRFRGVFTPHPAVDEVLDPGWRSLRRFSPALCLNFHGGSRSACLTALSGAPLRAGFAHYRMQWAYNLRIPRAQEILGVERKVHTAEHLASAMFYLGVPPAAIPRASLVAEGAPPQSRVAVLHAVAAQPAKSWPAPNFAAVARHLSHNGYECVFIGGPADDLSPFAPYRTLAGAPLGEIKRLLAGAALFVGNDSGPAHMAAAFGLPVVVLFGPSDPDIWGPWQTPGEVLRDPAGIAAIPPARVYEALERLGVHA